MIKLRSSQIDDIVQADEASFVDRVLLHVLEEVPSRLPLPLLREMVSNGLKRARDHGLHDTGQLVTFVTLMFALAPNFDLQPQLRAALEEPLPIDERWENLFDPKYDAAWEEAGAPEFYDQDAWFSDLANVGGKEGSDGF